MRVRPPKINGFPWWASYRFRLYMELMKPKQLALLMVTMYGSYFAGGGVIGWELFFLTVAGLASIGGATALNMYLETDIDGSMRRTSKRPLPKGEISKDGALAFSIALMTLGVVAAAMLNRYVLFSVTLGYYSYIVAYTVLSKRSASLAALILGSVAGSSPALGGWAAARGSIGLEGLLLAALVFVWQPAHVSLLNYYFREDYKRAGIPSLPLSETPRRLYYTLAASIALMLLLIWSYTYIGGKGYVTGIITTIVAYRSLYSLLNAKDESRALLNAFKGVSIMVAVPFILIPLEARMEEMEALILWE